MRITVTSEMTALSDVRAAIFCTNALTLDRPLLLLPGEVVGKADHLVKVEAELVDMDMPQLHRQVWKPEWRGSYRGLPWWGFQGGAADTHGIGNNQCGSSFYGPAYGGGVSHHGVGAGVGQSCDATGYPSSVASGGNLDRVLASAVV